MIIIEFIVYIQQINLTKQTTLQEETGNITKKSWIGENCSNLSETFDISMIGQLTQREMLWRKEQNYPLLIKILFDSSK